MTNESASEDMKNLWQGQPTEPPKIRPEDFRKKMSKFERSVFWRNMREYAAGAVVIAVFGYHYPKLHGLLVHVGSALIIAGTLYVLFQLHRRASALSAPADLGTSACIDFHRKSLERQRDALRGVWSWYLMPFVPGFTVLEIRLMVKHWTAHPADMEHLAIDFAVLSWVAAVFYVIWKLNRRAAEKLQTQIDELNALRGG